MKNVFIVIAILLFCAASSYAQSDTIAIKKSAFGTFYETGNKLLTKNNLQKQLRKDAAAAQLYKNGKGAKAAAFIFGFAGGFAIGAELGNALANGRSVNPVIIGAGAGLIALSVPFSRSAQRKMRGAVETYNAHRRKTAGPGLQPDAYFTFSGSSVGLRFVF